MYSTINRFCREVQRRHAEEKLTAAVTFKAEDVKLDGGRFQEYRDHEEEEQEEDNGDSGDEGVGVVGITQVVEDKDDE